MKFKLILYKSSLRIFRLVFNWLTKLFVSKLDKVSFTGTTGDFAGICILGFNCCLISENDRNIDVELHLQREV
jgi:cobalamin synthase